MEQSCDFPAEVAALTGRQEGGACWREHLPGASNGRAPKEQVLAGPFPQAAEGAGFEHGSGPEGIAQG